MERIKNARWLFIAAMILQTIIFGSGSALTKVAYDSVTPLWCMALRFGLATAIFMLIFGPRMMRQLRGVSVRIWMPAATCMAISFIACNVAFSFTAVTTVGFLVALPVVFTPILGAIVNKQRYPLGFIPFQAAVVCGLYMLCCNGGALTFGPGEVLGIIASVAMAASIVFSQRLLSQIDAITVAGTQVGMAFVLSLVCALALEPPVNVAAIEPTAWGTIVFLAVLSSCVAFLLQSAALKVLSSTTVSLLITGEPVFTALFSFAILGETLSLLGFAGAAMIIVAVVAATLYEGRQGEHGVPAPVSAPSSQPVSLQAASVKPSRAVSVRAATPVLALSQRMVSAASTRISQRAQTADRLLTKNPPYLGATRFVANEFATQEFGVRDFAGREKVVHPDRAA